MNYCIPRLVSLVMAAGALAGQIAHAEVAQPALRSLTVCADPGNMPLSNRQGEGFENKIAEVVGKALGIGVQYYWRPSIERGLMRTTLSEGNCDLWMDMASDTEGAIVLSRPLYRSTFVLAYRTDKGLNIKGLGDPAIEAPAGRRVPGVRHPRSPGEHGVVNNTVIHYLSHNADEQADNQPSYQVQQVIDGTLDVAAAWGPMAGYYKTVLHAPLVIEPVNIGEDAVPMEFDMTLAVPRGRPDIKAAIEQALEQHKDDVQPHSGRLRRSAGEVRCLSGVGRSALAWPVQARGHRASEPRANRRGTSRPHGRPQELAGAGCEPRQRARRRHRRQRHRSGALLARARRPCGCPRRRGQYAPHQCDALQLRRSGDLSRRAQGGRQSRRSQRLDAAHVRRVAGQSAARGHVDQARRQDRRRVDATGSRRSPSPRKTRRSRPPRHWSRQGPMSMRRLRRAATRR